MPCDIDNALILNNIEVIALSIDIVLIRVVSLIFHVGIYLFSHSMGSILLNTYHFDLLLVEDENYIIRKTRKWI